MRGAKNLPILSGLSDLLSFFGVFSTSRSVERLLFPFALCVIFFAKVLAYICTGVHFSQRQMRS